MNAIRIRRRIDSETLHLPELREMIGKEVEIIVLEETHGPAADRSEPRHDPYAAFFALAGTIDLDWEAYKETREASMT